MARHILICPSCKRYTMKDICPCCQQKTNHSRPPKYSPDDKYVEMKRKVKEEEYKKSGLL